MISYSVTPVAGTAITLTVPIGVKKMQIWWDTGTVTLKALPQELVITDAVITIEVQKLGKSFPACIKLYAVPATTIMHILLT